VNREVKELIGYLGFYRLFKLIGLYVRDNCPILL